ncbi:MAG: prolyl oligopeptidase family serine peptidase [Bacteroidota bacterium]
MKRKWQLILLVGLCFGYQFTLAQKPLVGSNVYDKWPKLELNDGTSISNNGKFMTYLLQGKEGMSTRVVQSLVTDWRVQWREKQTNCEFSQDNRKYIFMRHDSLCLGTLGGPEVLYILGVSRFNLLKRGISEDWLIYNLKTKPDELIFRDLQRGSQQIFANTQNYWPSNNGKSVVIQTKDEQIKLLILEQPEPKRVWFGKLSTDPVWAADETSFAFTGIAQGDSVNALYYYQSKSNITSKLLDQRFARLENNYDIIRANAISKDGNSVFFTAREKTKIAQISRNAKPVSVDLYSYKDARLQSEQLRTAKQLSDYKVVFQIADQRIVWIEKKGIRIWAYGSEINTNADDVLVDKIDDGSMAAGQDEWNWNTHVKHSIELLDIKDGQSHQLSPTLEHIKVPLYICQFSPNGKYVLWYDPLNKNYFCCDMSTYKVHNLTASISTNWSTYDIGGYNDEPADQFRPVGIAAFLPNDKGVLLYDLHDVYQIDLTGQKAPLCLTNYEGKRRHLSFRLAMYNGSDNARNVIKENGNESLLLNAFDLKTKMDGFYHSRLGAQRQPQRLTIQPYLLDGLPEYEVGGVNKPIKARDSNIYIVQHQSATEAPNLFSTTDFKSFKPLTDNAPQKAYNWLTSELITWKTFNRTISQGILYKPENFDPKKKYPVIFYYYEKYSNSLNRFLEPEANGATIDIPTFVSKGYLVFVPDIHYPLNTGQGYGCYNSVVSAAKYLSKMPWVDAKHMGINGHSRGGFETDYLITHTNIFAAAVAGAGYCDAISLYTHSGVDGRSGGQQYEVGHQRIGATLWQNPRLYLENSPILKADKVSTPFLMMNNKLDDNIPFTQGIEFFSSLRRLRKKAWMLQYDGQGHVILDKAAAWDFEIRMEQFFDHYLKGAPPPLWMTRGVSAKLKGIDDGLALDTSGQIP